MSELPYRQIHLDFHTAKSIPNVGSEFNKKEFGDMLKKANVNSINIFSKCHHGFSYYPTKLGVMHPNLKFDLMGEMIDVCHENNILAPIYFPVGWEEIAANHTEWLSVDIDGVIGMKKPFDNTYNRWRCLCFNKTGYLNYIKEQVIEIIDNYKVDGFWFDIIVQNQCVCSDCQRDMISQGLDPTLELDRLKFSHKVIESFMKNITELIRSKDESIDPFFNMSISPDNGTDKEFSILNKTQYMNRIEIESLPSELWGYNHFPLFVNYFNKFDKEIIGMNGKFHNYWGDFGTIRNSQALEYECFRMIANGAKCSTGDQLHPSGKINSKVYQVIGDVFAQIKEREPWCVNSKKISDVGIVLANRPLYSNYESDEGVMRMMLELKIPFDFIDVNEDLAKYKLIILPDEVRFNNEFADKLNTFIKNGGKLILNYHSGMCLDKNEFALDLGVTYKGEFSLNPSYYRFRNEFGIPDDYDYVMYKQNAKVKLNCGKVYADIVNPYFTRTYDNFCSHRQFPPNDVNGSPAIVKNGNIIYITSPIFSDYLEYGVRIYRDILENSINLLEYEKLIETNLPTTAELTLRRQNNNILVHIIHYIAQRTSRKLDIVDNKIPLYDIKMKIKNNDIPKKVYVAPSNQELKYTYENGFVNLIVPKIEGHAIVVIEN